MNHIALFFSLSSSILDQLWDGEGMRMQLSFSYFIICNQTFTNCASLNCAAVARSRQPSLQREGLFHCIDLTFYLAYLQLLCLLRIVYLMQLIEKSLMSVFLFLVMWFQHRHSGHHPVSFETARSPVGNKQRAGPRQVMNREREMRSIGCSCSSPS